MPAPAGFKTFVAGAVLSATSDVQVYLMDQVCTVWNDASARTSGLGSPAEGQLSYLKDTDSVEVYDGASWTAVGGTFTWTGSTANGLATYGSSTTVVAESTATYNGTTLALTTAGGGLKLDDLDSADANTLDDYEEGTFTITLTLGSGTASFSSGEDLCAYTRVGRVVHISGNCGISSVSTPSGICYISGLPFTSANLAEGSAYTNSSSSVSNLGTATTNYQAVCGTVIEASTTMLLRAQNGGTAMQNIGALLQGGTYVHVGGSYIAA